MACPPGYRPSKDGRRCIPKGPTTTAFNTLPRRVATSAPAGGMFPFTNSAAGPAPAVFTGPTPTPTPPPPTNPFVDNLTTSFPDPSPGATIPVSGGGGALAAAVTAAGAGDRLLITDSLDYSAINITGKTGLTIEADTGQTPTITAAPGPSNSCVRFGAGNISILLKGIGFIGNGNLNTLSIPDCGLVLGTPGITGFTDADSIAIVDCTFSELNPALGVPGIQLVGTDGSLHLRAKVIGCTFTDMATPAFTTGAGWGAITIGGFGGGPEGVWVQNCKILRSAVARALSSMRGVVLKNLESTVEDVLCYDIGTAGSNEAFKHNNEAQYGTVPGGTSAWRNCVAYNAKRGFRITQPAATMAVDHATFYNDTAGIAAAQTIMQESSGTMTVTSSVIEGAGDGTAFSAGIAGSENNNDVFNVAALGIALDASDLTIDPVLNDTPNNDYRATDPSVAAGGVGATPMGVYYPGGTVIFWAGVP